MNFRHQTDLNLRRIYDLSDIAIERFAGHVDVRSRLSAGVYSIQANRNDVWVGDSGVPAWLQFPLLADVPALRGLVLCSISAVRRVTSLAPISWQLWGQTVASLAIRPFHARCTLATASVTIGVALIPRTGFRGGILVPPSSGQVARESPVSTHRGKQQRACDCLWMSAAGLRVPMISWRSTKHVVKCTGRCAARLTFYRLHLLGLAHAAHLSVQGRDFS